MIIYILIIILILFFFNIEAFDYTKYNYNPFYEFLQGNNNFNPYDNNTNNNNYYNLINYHTNNTNSDSDIRGTTVIFDNRIKNVVSIESNNEINNNEINNNKQNNINQKKCCLVSKVLNRDNNNIGQFKYNFIKLENEQCNLDLYNLDNNNQLLFDGENNWTNNNCINDNITQNIGSCRRNNFECVDFIDKNICENMINKNNKLETGIQNQIMEWSLLTCYDPVYKKVTLDI
jgi:hypothetical protein